jgi:16S rRNA (cytidine1402-2'-O)-methyltransferase
MPVPIHFAGRKQAMTADLSSGAQSLGRLYLVPNTLDLGTFGDNAVPDLQEVLPLGALRIAAGLSHWVVENARSARALLKRVNAVVPLAQPLQSLSMTELPRPVKGGGKPVDKTPWRDLLAPALAGHDIGLLSEAGLPAVADPGARLVLEAHSCGVPVWPLSGPSSLILAVAASGLNGQSFAFVGYLPTDSAARAVKLRELEGQSRRLQQTQLLIETPYRNAALLDGLLATLAPQTWLNISCGLTLAGGFSQTKRISQWRDSETRLPADRPSVFSFLAG